MKKPCCGSGRVVTGPQPAKPLPVYTSNFSLYQDFIAKAKAKQLHSKPNNQ